LPVYWANVLAFGSSATATNGNEADGQIEALEKPFGVAVLHILSDGAEWNNVRAFRRRTRVTPDNAANVDADFKFPINRLHVQANATASAKVKCCSAIRETLLNG
jgi:hypothetical protein